MQLFKSGFKDFLYLLLPIQLKNLRIDNLSDILTSLLFNAFLMPRKRSTKGKSRYKPII